MPNGDTAPATGAYTQDLAACFADAIGAPGLDRVAFAAALAQTGPALAAIRAAHRDGSLPLLRLPGMRGDLPALSRTAGRCRDRFDRMVVLGTGGSSLGGKTLCALADRGFGPPPGAPRIDFAENVDPDALDAMFAALDLARTGWLAVSKSGETAETLAQLLVVLAALEAEGLDAGACVTALAQPGDNTLRRLAAAHGVPVLDCDPGIGGRYSALSAPGLLPAMIAGLDVAAIREGAAAVLDPVLAGAPPREVPAAEGAALAHLALQSRGIAQTVLMPYADRLADFGRWFRQLWAESLGKDGAGTTPINALGTIDQHSQLQLWLDGPADKLFTLIVLDRAGTGARIPASLAADPALAYIRDKTVGDLMAAEQRATAEVLARSGRPVRVTRLSALDERSMGALMMHFMLETMIAAHLLGVDAFDQPAVEQGKALTRSYLAAGREGP
ncbi:MAG: glucose-6-phosphate isomerase [Defluviicoccus sp.]|nr:glucose-6-phosphate isomerase [Defluviicoccus sp.]MDE0386004.1 glucose-6-phosphate isomerase [Defluviicoccus sp.]